MKQIAILTGYLLFVVLCGFAETQYYITNPVFHVDDPTTGEPLSGGLIYFYEPNSTTPKDTYSAASGAAEYVNTNPVVLNAYGNATIYGASTYKIVIKRSSGTTLATMDYVQVSQTVTTFASEILAGVDAAAVRESLGLGSAAILDASSGPAGGQVLVLSATGALPAIDGSALTGLTEDQTRVLPQGYLSGYGLSNYTSGEIQIATGQCRDHGNTEDIILSSVFVKCVTDTFAEGTSAGGNLSGFVSGTTSTWHVFAIRAVTPAVERTDICFSSSLNPISLPSDFSKYRRIGSVLTGADGVILKFSQNGDEFLWDVPWVDINPASSANASTTETTYTLTYVPNGISVNAILNAYAQKNSQNYMSYSLYPAAISLDGSFPADGTTLMRAYIQHPKQDFIYMAADYAPTGELATGNHQIRTNSSRQIKGIASSDNSYLMVLTLGYIDRRGRDD